jgi:nucleoside-diphosphate-sugar epimerase
MSHFEKVLVTGGTGAIGSNIVDELVLAGAERLDHRKFRSTSCVGRETVIARRTRGHMRSDGKHTHNVIAARAAVRTEQDQLSVARMARATPTLATP